MERGGVIVFLISASAMHEITAAVMLGMGILAFSVAVLIENQNRQIAMLGNRDC